MGASGKFAALYYSIPDRVAANLGFRTRGVESDATLPAVYELQAASLLLQLWLTFGVFLGELDLGDRDQQFGPRF